MRKCPKCKRPLRKSAKFCPACGAKSEKRPRSAFIILVIAVVLSIGAVGCIGMAVFTDNRALNALNTSHRAIVENDLELFAAGDITEITQRVFGEGFDSTVSANSDKGIVADLFANAQVQVSSTDATTITYTIVSSDISDFFRAESEKLQTITTTEELRQALIDYADTAPEKEYTVVLPYTISEEKEIEIEYDDPEFINAMTGGLLDAYADLYGQYLEEAE